MSVPRPGDQVPPDQPHAGFALLLSLSMAQFMVVLDFTIVNVTLPSIQRELHVATMTLQWVVSAYARCTGAPCPWPASRRTSSGNVLLGAELADGQQRVLRQR